jgi:putative restriction endonuclease
LVRPRRAGFRLILDVAYDRACAVTGNDVVPSLHAAHIIADAFGGPLVLSNGLLLRRDLHGLLETGYMSISRDYRVMISVWLPRDYVRGDDYVRFNNAPLRLPPTRDDWPDQDLLEQHRSSVFFRGGQFEA